MRYLGGRAESVSDGIVQGEVDREANADGDRHRLENVELPAEQHEPADLNAGQPPKSRPR